MSRAQAHGADAASGKLRSREPQHSNGFHAARLEKPQFRLDLGRSLRAYRALVISITLFGIALASYYVWKFWPVYSAEALVYIQPAPAIESSSGAVLHWPYSYDPATYESYLQQQMLSMTSADVLKGALSKLDGFARFGESEEDAAERLRRTVDVARLGNTYEVGITAQAHGAQLAADEANAIAASYIENTAREQKARDAERMGVLREEADRVKKQLDANRAEQSAVAGGVETHADLAFEMVRLQKRYDDLDGQIQNLSIEDAAPGTAHVSAAAAVPTHPVPDDVVPNGLMLAFGFFILAMLAALAVQKLDTKVHLATDIEQVTGFSPVVALPDFDEVAKDVFEEQLLRLSAAVESAVDEGDLKSCVFTGAGAAVGVSTLAARVRSLMEGVGRTAVLVDAAGRQPSVWPKSDSDVGEESSEARPLALLQRLTDEARMHEGMTVLADTAPLTHSAEAEYLVRNTDCVVVVVESGITTRDELRATSRALQRLNVGTVGYVLNRVALARADAEFKSAVTAMEEHARVRRRVEPEPVRTRRVQAQPAEDTSRTEEQPGELDEIRASETEETAVSTAAKVAAAAAPPQEAAPTARSEMAGQAESNSVREEHASGQWWLTDPELNPDIARLKEVLTRIEEPRERQAAPAAQKPAAPPTEQESRLNSLRKLFAERNAAAALNAAQPQGHPAPQSEEPPRTAQRGRITVPGPEEETAAAGHAPTLQQPEERKKGTPEVTTLPEILPPRKTAGGKREEDAASRRERRDTWDDVGVLPSWRGQYRRKE